MRKIFFECSNGEHSTNVKLSWKFKKSFAVLSNGATARLIKLGKIFPASSNGGDTGLL